MVKARSGRSPTRREFLYAAGQGGALLQGAGRIAAAGRPAPAGATRKIRLGVVGGGFGATFHWHEHPNCEVAAVTDLRSDRRQRLRDRYRCDFVYDSLQEMLRRAQKLDAVAVFSGAPDHVAHAAMCFERGLHVVSACPAAITLEEAAKLKELKEKTGLRYMMAESSYYRGACIYARDLYQRGGFGQLFYSEVEYYHDGGERAKLVADKSSRLWEPDGSRSWRWGFPPMLYPTHSLGYIVGVTRERIVKVSSLGWGAAPYPPLKNNRYNNPFLNEAALMQTDRGHVVRCNVFWCVGAIEERAQWFGEKGSLYMENTGVHPDTWKDYEMSARRIQLPEYWKGDMVPAPMRHLSGHGGSAVLITAEFINALIEDREPAIDVYESLAMTVPGIVAHQSSLKNGEQLSVPPLDRKA